MYKISNISITVNQKQEEKKIQEPLSFFGEEEEEPLTDSFFDGFWFNFIGFTLLSGFAGVMSGLTIGYLSIDMLILEIKINSGTEQEKKYANRIKKVVSDHHWILVSLLLCNAFACEAMPILLDKLVNDLMAIIISVSVLLFVGEIIPQAVCTGPNQMKIAAFLAPFTYALMIITYPLSYPIAKFMDCVVGLHGKTRFCNSDLKSVIELHVKEYKGNLNTQQMGYFTGFLDIMNKKVGELMIPIEKSFKLSNKYKIDKINIERLINSGFSRIPIYEDNQNNLIGILRLKDLVGIDLLHPSMLNELDINLYEAVHVNENTYFLDLFEKFKEGQSRMAFVHKDSKDSKDEQLLPDKEKEEDQKEEDQKEDQIEAKEPLLINNIIEDEDNQIIDTNTKKEKKKNKNKKYFNNSPIIGIITLEDLIESWLKIHILDEENYDVDEKFRPRRKTTF
jgi:metal transporter CNNM